MPRTFFTADNHFGHNGVISMCGRPFSSVAEMDNAMVDNWNAVVRMEDVVWHVGDFAHRMEQSAMKRVFQSLNGEKHLIAGNHDDANTCALGWKSISRVAEINADGQRVVLSHYAMRTWPSQRKGSWQLFGHSHGRLPGNSQSTDVGVDCWNFMPVTVAQIRERLFTLPEPESEIGNHNISLKP